MSNSYFPFSMREQKRFYITPKERKLLDMKSKFSVNMSSIKLHVWLTHGISRWPTHNVVEAKIVFNFQHSKKKRNVWGKNIICQQQYTIAINKISNKSIKLYELSPDILLITSSLSRRGKGPNKNYNRAIDRR